MSGWERVCVFITSDMLFSGTIAVSLLIIGYVCAATSRNCVYSFHIGQSKDAMAGRFAFVSLVLYLTAGFTFAVIGLHIVSTEYKNGTWSRVLVKNSVVYEISNPLTEWFDEVYEELREDYKIK